MAENIKKWVYKRLRDDTDLRVITGYTSSRKMVYHRNDAPNNINSLLTSSNCYLTFFLLTDTPLGEDTAWEVQIPDLTYQISIYAKKASVLESAFYRVDKLFNNIIHPSISGYWVSAIHRVGQFEDFNKDDRIHIKHLDYKFFNIYDESESN